MPSSPNKQENGWNEWQRHVLSELKRYNGWMTSIDRNLNKVQMDIAVLKVKSSLWGAAAGGITVLVIVAVGIIIRLNL